MGILRLILALAVVAGHSTAIFGFILVGGKIAVQTFYIISGFYMSLILNEKYVGKINSYFLFISNRFLRLFPIFWVVLVLTVLLSMGQYVITHGRSAGAFQPYLNYFSQYGRGSISLSTWFLIIVSNILIFGRDLIVFLGINPITGGVFFTSNFKLTHPELNAFLLVPQAWTIGVELLFYLIIPFLIRLKIGMISLVILASLILRFYLYSKGLDHDPWTYRFFPLELAFFLLGNLAYHLYTKIKNIQIDDRILWIAFAVIFAEILFYPWIKLEYKEPIYFTLFFLFLPFIFMATKNLRWDYHIGELSYPVYINHILVLALIAHLPRLQSLGTTLAIASIGCAFLLNKWVANPIERIRQLRITKAQAKSKTLKILDKETFPRPAEVSVS